MTAPEPVRRRILYVDHECHRQTHSTEFLRDLLAQRFDVGECFIRGRFGAQMCTPGDAAGYDAAVFFQFLPSLRRLRSFGMPCFYVPMYDAEAFNPWQWRRLRQLGTGVISFSAKMTEYIALQGHRPLDVRYFPQGVPLAPGDPRRVYLWERGNANFPMLKSLFSPNDVDEVVLRRSADSPPLSASDRTMYRVREVSPVYHQTRAEYFESFKDCGVYIAPRLKEGIGLSFLEALAMGKCVVAHRDATMTEYMAHGTTGFFVNMEQCPQPRIGTTDVPGIQSNVMRQREAWERRWEQDRARILDAVTRRLESAGQPPRLPPLAWWGMAPLQLVWDVWTLGRQSWGRVRSRRRP